MNLFKRFKERMAAGRARAIAQQRAELMHAARILADDDAQFHGRRVPDDDEDGYRSAISEDWGDDDE